ncbi:MAG: tripartite tricarboxylate transporter substrate binding protein [Hyphomicrobiales bacterium]|nr:tripartite tricarboxylate transporter substrate binding protein [Hyphomicrobiales bacterium]
MIGTRAMLATVVVIGLTATSAGSARTQGYPAQSVTFVVSFAAGGVADVIARLVAQKLAERAGWKVVVENRGGAGGNLAARMVSTAAADGYTVLATTTALAINATTSRNKGYAVENLKPVAVVASTPDVLAIHPSNPAKTLSELIANARGSVLAFGSSGMGTTPHIATEYLLRELAKLEVTHVPFSGGAPAVSAAIGNHVALLSASLPTAVTQINDGALRGIGVASPRRSASAPNVPTYAESGFPDLYSATWIGFFVPAATSDAIVERLNGQVNEALTIPEVRQRLAAIGFEPISTTPAEAADYFKAEVASWGKMARAIGFSSE